MDEYSQASIIEIKRIVKILEHNQSINYSMLKAIGESLDIEWVIEE